MDAAVWRNLDACTDLSELGCLLEDRDSVAFVAQCDGGGKASKACSCDNNF